MFRFARLARGLADDPALILALVGFVLAGAGALRLESPLGQSVEDFRAKNGAAILLVLIGLLLFWLGQWGRSADRGDFANRDRAPSPRRRPRGGRLLVRRVVGAALLALALALYAWTIHQAWVKATGLGQVATFLLSLGSACAGAALMESRGRPWTRDIGWFASPAKGSWFRRDGPWLAILLALWFGLMATRLTTSPGFFHGDEATVVMYGRSTFLFDDARKNSTPWETLYAPFLAGVPRALAMRAWPSNPYLGPRLCTLAVATFGLAIFFLLVREKLGRRAAWMALALASTHHAMQAFARMGILSHDGLALLCAFALAWLAMWRTRRASLGLLAGVCAGMAYYTYHGALLAFPLAAGMLALEGARRPASLLSRWRAVAAFALGAAVAAAPMRVHYRDHPQGIEFRTAAVSVLSKRSLENEFKATGAASLPDLLALRSWRAFGGSLLWPDTSSNYNYHGLPILDRATCAMTLTGLVGALALWRRRRFMAMAALWIPATLVLGALLSTSPDPPYVPRVMMMFPAAFALSAWSMESLARRAGAAFGPRAGWALRAAAWLWIASIAARNVWHYQRIYLGDRANPAYATPRPGFMNFLRTFPPDAHMVYFASAIDQMNISSYQMFDGGLSKDLIVDKSHAIPPYWPWSDLTAYIFRVPEFADAERRFLADYPGLQPQEIVNPFIPGPATHHVYWIKNPAPQERKR